MSVQVFRREAMSRKCVYEWFKRFHEGKETTDDEPRLGQPPISRTPEIIEKVRQMLAQNWRLMLRLIAEELGISKDTMHTIVRDDLGKRKTCSQFVPHKLLQTSSCFSVEGGRERDTFVDVNAIKDHVTAVLRSIPQEAFADCFRKLYKLGQM